VKPEPQADIYSCCEHSRESFIELINAIQALGYDRETSCQYAAWIGAAGPIRDQAGNIVVLDDLGRVVDRIALAWFD